MASSTDLPVNSWYSLMASVVSLVGRSAFGWAGSSTWPRGRGRRVSRAPPRWVDSGSGGLGSGIFTGKRGEWLRANSGYQPNSGNMPPQPRIRYCWMIWMIVAVIQ